jgi:hypothetical protein
VVKTKVVPGLISGRPFFGNNPTLMDVYIVKGEENPE